MSNQVWTSLPRESQDDIILRFSNGEDVFVLANEYHILPSSLSRKMRKLKSDGIYDYILNKIRSSTNNSNNPSIKRENIITSNIPGIKKNNPFLKVVDSRRELYKAQPTTDFVLINQDKKPSNRIMLVNSKKEWSGIFFTDVHCPFQDELSVSAFMRVLRILDCNIIVNGGDNLDLYGLSTYGKEIDMLFQANFHREVEQHNIFMDKIASIASNIPKISLYGNHMERYDKWIENTPFVSMGYLNSSLSLDSILSMKYYGWLPFQGTIMFTEENNINAPKPKLLLDHGTKASSGATKSAASQFNSFGAVSYMMGHVHRLGVAYKKTLHGIHCVGEGGTLRNLSPEYMKYPDWQNGMLHFTVSGDTVTMTPILIQNGIAYVGNSKI